MGNDLLSISRAPAKRNWSLWRGCVLPVYCKLLVTGEPRLVGLYYRTQSVTRCIVRLEWRDGNVWVRDGQDAPWHVHAAGSDSSREWADIMCEKYALEWACDELKRDLDLRRVA